MVSAIHDEKLRLIPIDAVPPVPRGLPSSAMAFSGNPTRPSGLTLIY